MDKENGDTVTFRSLGICDQLAGACDELGWKSPTKIQVEAIPHALAGKDLIGLAQTGSGKIGAFALPILQALLDEPKSFFACVLSPTRELAIQIGEQFEAFGAGIGVKCAVVVGGIDRMQQTIALAKRPHIVVATPVHLVDHLSDTKGFSLRSLKYLVLDEADRLLNKEFEKSIDEILGVIPRERNTYLFSATMTKKVKKLERACLRDPVKIGALTKYTTVGTLKLRVRFIPAKHKDCYLVFILTEMSGSTSMVFVRTRESTRLLALILRNLGFRAIPISGQMTQTKRLAVMNQFKSGECNILIATDEISRGLYIPSVDVVINYDIPSNSKDYYHRVGRTGRAGRFPVAISLVDQYELEWHLQIEKLIGYKLPEYPAQQEEVLLLLERVSEAKRLSIMEPCYIEQLPDDLLIRMLSSLNNIVEIASTSILNRRWRYLWLNTAFLNFDPNTVLPMEKWREKGQDWYVSWVNKVIEARARAKDAYSPQLMPVKKFRIWYALDAISQGHHIDRWINFAVSTPLETIHLHFRPCPGGLDRYKLSIESWLNAPSGPSNLRCLKSLHLWHIDVSKQFIDFILSSCPLLEDLSFVSAGNIKDLDIVSGVPPLRLTQLEIDSYDRAITLTELCAPYLTSFSIYLNTFNPQKIDVPMLTHLSIRCNVDALWSSFPQLEKLELHMQWLEWFGLEQIPEMVKLKYLKMSVDYSTHLIYDVILNFINACPLLQTLAFEVTVGFELHRIGRPGKKKIWNRAAKMGYCFKCLKVFEVYGGRGNTIYREIVKIIISKAPNLKKLYVSEHYCASKFRYQEPSTPTQVRKLEAKAKGLCRGRHVQVNIRNVCFDIISD